MLSACADAAPAGTYYAGTSGSSRRLRGRNRTVGRPLGRSWYARDARLSAIIARIGHARCGLPDRRGLDGRLTSNRRLACPARAWPDGCASQVRSAEGWLEVVVERLGDSSIKIAVLSGVSARDREIVADDIAELARPASPAAADDAARRLDPA